MLRFALGGVSGIGGAKKNWVGGGGKKKRLRRRKGRSQADPWGKQKKTKKIVTQIRKKTREGGKKVQGKDKKRGRPWQ